MPVTEVRHPLVKHKIGLMREADISTKKFRELTAELARLLTYEACRDFEVETVTLEGWAGPVAVEQIKGKKVTVVPILRAGLGMLDGIGRLFSHKTDRLVRTELVVFLRPTLVEHPAVHGGDLAGLAGALPDAGFFNGSER